MDVEERLRRGLKAEAAQVHPSSGAWARLERRLRPRSGGRRVALAVASVAVATGLMVVLASGLLVDEGDVTEVATSPSRPSITAGWERCANAVHRYSIEYPRGWHTAARTRMEECRLFDPEPVTIVEGSEYPAAALEVAPTDDAFDQVVRSLTDPLFWRDVSRSASMSAGRRGVLVEGVSTGEGPYVEGVRKYAYVIDRGGHGFVVSTTVPASRAGRYGEFTDIVDAAVRSLTFHEG
jgi:hypothetical protein